MNKRQQFYEFGPFRIDPGRRLLLRDSQPVPVQPKAFDILLALVENKEKVVLKDELMRTVWPETFVEESNLAQHIFVLRKALGDVVGENRYIVTIPGRGYRFTGQVNTIPAVAGQEDEIEVRSRSLSRVVINETVPARTLALTGDRSRMRRAIFYVALVIAVVAAVLFRPYVPPPRVWRIRQLTHLGTLVYNTAVVTDGPRIYFRAWMAGGKRVIRYVSPEGGEVFPVEDPLPAMDINDISPSGAEFLINNLSDSDGSTESDNYAFWRAPVSPGSPRPLGVRAGNARWSPDGSTIVFTHDSSLYLVNSDGTNSRKLTATPGYALSPSWSPDGQRIRFSVADPQGRGLALWQANVATRTVRPVLPDWPVSARQRSGPWSPDGRYYFFTGLGEENRDIWAMREPQGTLRRVNSRPVRLTAGPLNFYQLTPSKDGKSIFVIGQQVRGQLVRFDRVSRQYLLYAKGISADHVAFSRDGQWVAYVEYPARVLIRARIDGSERRQLTFPPMRVSHPQWSPDGTQLAFQGAADLASPSRIYIVSRDGGRPVLATPERNDRQRYPSWFSQGDSILFSGSDETGANSALYTVDLKTRQVSLLPGTSGLYWGQISPDGRHVVALTDPRQKLMLYDTISHDTRMLAGLADYPIWSRDGQYVYFSTLFFNHDDSGIYRWQLSTGKLEEVLPAPDFSLSGIWGTWFGLTPDGDPLVVRDMSVTDLYALDVDLP